jgi:hypothetical protein
MPERGIPRATLSRSWLTPQTHRQLADRISSPYTGLPGFDPLRADPRFEAILARLELPPAGRSIGGVTR